MKGVIFLRKRRRNNVAYIKYKQVKRYFSEAYNGKILDFSDKNIVFDVLISNKSQNTSIEIKERNLQEYFYNQDDILLELYQHKDITKHPAQYDITENLKAVGWFLKTDCDRLVYFKYCGDETTVYDIDWRPFKAWVLDSSKYFPVRDLVESHKTTGSYNISVPFNMIPRRMAFKTIYKGEEHE